MIHIVWTLTSCYHCDRNSNSQIQNKVGQFPLSQSIRQRLSSVDNQVQQDHVRTSTLGYKDLGDHDNKQDKTLIYAEAHNLQRHLQLEKCFSL